MEITFELYMSRTHAAHAEYFTVEPLPSFVRREFQLKVILERVTRFYLSRHWFRLRFQQQRCYSPARLLSSVTEPRLVGLPPALGTQSSRLLSLSTAHAQAVGTTAYPGPVATASSSVTTINVFQLPPSLAACCHRES